MGVTSIEWTATVNADGTVTPGRTWNPTRGCSRVSEGCRNCYAEKQAYRFSRPDMGPAEFTARKEGGDLPPFYGFVTKVNGHASWTGKVELVESMLKLPMGWRKPCRIFVNSMSDLFHEALPDEAIDSVFAVMALCPQHTFQILTKRPGRMLKYFEDANYRQEVIGIRAEYMSGLDRHFDGPGTTPGYGVTWRLPFKNVWLGVSVEDQATADERIPLLLQAPAAIRFVSYEPALGPVDFSKWLEGSEEHGVDWSRPVGQKVGACIGWTPPLDWIIVGGESGPGARPFDLQWARTIIEQCREVEVACFFKQAGARPYQMAADVPKNTRAWPYSKQFPDGDRIYTRLNDRKGGSLSELPCDMCVRQFPFVQSSDNVHNRV